mgnify:CR=1 FL=1
MKTISHSELLSLLQSKQGKGTFAVSLETVTDARALKTGNPYKGKKIFKKSKFATILGANYERAVQREGGRQGEEAAADFVASALPKDRDWQVPGLVLYSVKNPGVLYLRTQSTPGQRNLATARVDYIDVDGNEISREKAEKFLPVRSASIAQLAAGVGETALVNGEGAESGQIQVNDFKFSSIRSITIDGEQIQISPESTAESD